MAEADAARIYERHFNGAPPPPQDYKTLQDYLFAYVREAGRLGLAIHIHSANGGGFNYDQRGSNPLMLTWAFNEPALRKTNFVIVHGGYPHYRETGGLISKPNVYADFSALSFFEGVQGQAELLRGWLSLWPEKILFGTDATPNTDETSWEEDRLDRVTDRARGAGDRAHRHDPGRRDYARARLGAGEAWCSAKTRKKNSTGSESAYEHALSAATVHDRHLAPLALLALSPLAPLAPSPAAVTSRSRLAAARRRRATSATHR